MARCIRRGGTRRPSAHRAGLSSVEPGPLERRIPPVVRAQLAGSGGLRGVGKRVPSRATAERIAGIFDAVADPARLRILVALERSPLCPCLVQEVEPMKNSVLSYHLRILRRAGLVTMSATSNYRIYKASSLGVMLISFARELIPPASTRWRALSTHSMFHG